jgi:hypothetical protein
MWLQPHQSRATTTTTTKLRNENWVIRISIHPKAEYPEEQHHNIQHKPFLLALYWLLFELWGLKN